MVCQSWGGLVRVFPALPTAWQDLVVHDFRTEGAFLLSAAREKGATRWVRLASEAGAITAKGGHPHLTIRPVAPIAPAARWGLPA